MNYYGNNFVMYDNNNGPDYIEVKPWPRLWARLLDYVLFITALSFIYNKATGSLVSPGNSLLLNMAAIAGWVPLEALLLSILGATPGKWLLNISVRDECGKKLGFAKAFKRSLLVWLCGIWAGIPVISAIGLVNSYLRLTGKRTTIWDSKTFSKVDHDYHQSLKVLTAAALIIAITISQYILPNQDSLIFNNKYAFPILENFDYIFSSNSEAEYINRDALKLINEGDYAQAEKMLFAALDSDPSNNDKDDIYNNLSLLYYHTKDYLKSLDYIEKSLDITPNTSVEYSNYGNVLYALGRLPEAEDAYRRSTNFLDAVSYGHYGLGLVNYDRYDYIKAKEIFLKYTDMEKNDPDGWIYLGLSCLYGEKDTIKSKEYLDKALELAPTYADAIDSMALYYDYTGAKGKVKDLYVNALSDNPDDYDLLCNTAQYHYYEGLAEDAIKYADLAISKNDMDYTAYKIKANACYYKNDEEGAEQAINKILLINENDPVAYYIAGDIFYNAYKYKQAIENYEHVIEMNPSNIGAHLGIIGSLYYRKRYSQCLSFALEAEKKFKDSEILWYIGDAYSCLNDSEKAISYYEKALEMDSDNQSIMISAGWENFYNFDFDKAQDYANNILEIDSSSYGAKNLKEAVEKRRGNISEQIAEFVEKNYLYFQSNSGFDSIRGDLKVKGHASNQDILELFSKAYKKDDMFSFVLYDDYYRQYLEMRDEKTVESKIIDKDIIYTKITSFSENTANEFLDVIDFIEDSENKYLVIDLRNNGGGDTGA